MGTPITTPKAFAKHERLKEAIRMRRDGSTFDEIAEKLGWKDRSSAFRAVKKELKDALLSEASELKLVMNHRLERQIKEVIEDIEAADEIKDKALCRDKLVKLFDRQAKLFGLDSPVKVANTDSEGNDRPAATVTFYLPDNGRDSNGNTPAGNAGQLSLDES